MRHSLKGSGAESINRIRLEFKASTYNIINHTFLSINRIRLEFKVIRIFCEYRLGGVLIESDWNLKDITYNVDKSNKTY